MTNPEKIEEAFVYDGLNRKKLVKSGDIVDLLLPSEKLKLLTPEEIENDEDFFVKEDYDFLKRWLGEGPFKISWIGLWPCGTTMLYLNSQNGEPGVHASNFKYINSSS